MADRAWTEVAGAMAELRALSGAASLLGWDQETYLPPAGGTARAEQLAALQGVVHERLVGPALGDAIDAAAAAPRTDRERAALRALRHDRERAVRIPGDLVRALALAQSRAVEAWKGARAGDDFAAFAPHLEGLVRIRREMADAWGVPPGGERYDALLEGYEEGMRVARLEPLLRRLAGWLAPAVDALSARPPPDDGFLRGRFDVDAQWAFTLELLDAMGFDRAAGRQDRSVHPFTVGLDPGDVRVTTRTFEALPTSAIFSTLHEGGHGLYEQGLPAEERASFVCAAPSMGLHESQSRLWENLVGRSLPFWRAFLPRLAARFPQLRGVPAEAFHRAVNRVERSLVRVEADEVTYNLHIALRFELELALVRGELAVRDLPGAWNERSERILGLRPPRDADGVLQDIHWAWGELGYFPTYALGNLYAATLFAAARRDLPDLDDRIGQGDLAPLLGWLREKVHRRGRDATAEEIVRDATGRGLDDRDFEAYVRSKYGALYGVAL